MKTKDLIIKLLNEPMNEEADLYGVLARPVTDICTTLSRDTCMRCRQELGMESGKMRYCWWCGAQIRGYEREGF